MHHDLGIDAYRVGITHDWILANKGHVHRQRSLRSGWGSAAACALLHRLIDGNQFRCFIDHVGWAGAGLKCGKPRVDLSIGNGVCKGSNDGVRKGLPVGIPEGIAGQVIDVSAAYAKVMLITDRNSAVDALVQRTRARGIIKGESTSSCVFQYALRKDEVNIGDKIVASGLDGVFPRGMPIGEVSEVVKRAAGIFQEVSVTPYVDFEKIEEMLVFLTPLQDQLVNPQ